VSHAAAVTVYYE